MRLPSLEGQQCETVDEHDEKERGNSSRSNPYKVGGTRNRLPYVIILYKRQEQQNMAFEKIKKFWPPI